jgi:HK97 family phage portal protein
MNEAKPGIMRRFLGQTGQWLATVGGSTLAAPSRWLSSFLGGNPGNESQPYVNEHTAMNYLAVYNCVSLISSSIAALPFVVYRRDGRNRGRATDRPEYRMLQVEWNPDTSAMSAREASIAHLLTWGNGYSQIVRNKSGSKVNELRLLTPDLVRPCRNDRTKKIVYEVKDRQTNQVIAELPGDEVLHVPGLGFDGLIGYSPIRVARSAVRMGLQQDLEAEKFITRGIRPPGAIRFPAGMKFKNEQEAIAFRERFNRYHAGPESQTNALILEDGIGWESLGVDPKSAQLLESRRFSRREICGLYRVPPVMVGDVEASTSWGTGIDAQKDGFVTFTLLSWMKRVEQEYNRKLFGGGEGEFYCEHVAEGLLRGDIQKRSAALQIQHMRGIITDNEWRELENRNPVDGGDVRHFPLAEGRIDLEGNILPSLDTTATPAAPMETPEGEDVPDLIDPNAPAKKPAPEDDSEDPMED